jgi:16S rRNA (uracil1498-N3)-methyltransferase
MHLFYSPNVIGNEHILNEEESYHCTKVLRLTEGAKIQLVDGLGGFFEAEISGITKKAVRLKIVKAISGFGKRNHYLHIAIAPTKNIDRIEWFLEKATEIGVDEISLLLCEHSERKVVKEERLNKVVISAMKQSLHAYLPKLNPMVSFSDFVKSNHQNQCFIAHCIANEERSYLQSMLKPANSATVLIGPEGDFSPAEIKLALQYNYKPISLGNSRLRTETAGVAACLEVNLLNRNENSQ